MAGVNQRTGGAVSRAPVTITHDHVAPLVKAVLGAFLGVLVILVCWAAEWLAHRVGPVALHRSTILAWVVDALPVTMAILGWGSGSTVRRERVDLIPPQPRRMLSTEPEGATPPPPPPSPLPHRDALTAPTRRGATPPPVPSRLSTPAPVQRAVIPDDGVAQIPAGEGEVVLVVDGSPEGPATVSWLEERGYRVVHVGDAASGSIARQAEHPELAVVAGDAQGAEALVAELGRHRVPLIVIAGAHMQLPPVAVCTVRPLSPRRIADAFAQLLVADEGGGFEY